MHPRGHATASDHKLFGMTTESDQTTQTERIPGFGRRVQEVLDEADLNKTDAMRRLGVAYTTVTKWVDGSNTPNVANLVPLAELGGVHVEWLITGNGPKYMDESRNAAADKAERERRARYEQAVSAYLANEIASGVKPQVAAMLRNFDFSSLGIESPTLGQVHSVQELIDKQTQLRQFAQDGGPK